MEEGGMIAEEGGMIVEKEEQRREEGVSSGGRVNYTSASSIPAR